MSTELRLKMVALVAVLVCLILLALPSTVTHESGGKINCGNVFAPADIWGCDGAASSRLTIALIVGAVGVAARYGASPVKKREGQ